jgi:hypothetical protein
MISFPEKSTVRVSETLARELLRAAESLPQYDNREFYSTSLQVSVLAGVRAAAQDAFDSLIDDLKQRLAGWPFCVLVKGLDFDPGNKVFVAINRAFGELVARPYEKPRAQLVHYIQPSPT